MTTEEPLVVIPGQEKILRIEIPSESARSNGHRHIICPRCAHHEFMVFIDLMPDKTELHCVNCNAALHLTTSEK